MVRSIEKSPILYSSYISASHGAEYNQEELCVLFIHMHAPRPFVGTFSESDFSCLTVSWVGHYLHPFEPGIEQGMDYNLLQWIARVG